MTGTFEYERGDKRAVPDFNVFFRYYANYPYYSDAIWYLTQMRRWGQIAESKAGRVVRSRPRRSVYRPDIYLEAAKPAGRRRQGEAGRLPVDKRRLPRRRPTSSSMASISTAASRTRTSKACDRAEGQQSRERRRRRRRTVVDREVPRAPTASGRD